MMRVSRVHDAEDYSIWTNNDSKGNSMMMSE
jgi:hypothetical protein